MSDHSRTEWAFDGVSVAVLADCHIHPGGGPAFPPELLEALVGVDLIVTLGDMGEAAGLDQLSEIAPVVGVRGADDSDDPRTASGSLVLISASQAVGCIFDATAAGLAMSSDPFTPTADFATVAKRIFGREVGILLHASTHKSEWASFDEVLAFNPGSAVLPADGHGPTFLRLTANNGVFVGSVIHLD